jgi:hypothetical protein
MGHKMISLNKSYRMVLATLFTVLAPFSFVSCSSRPAKNQASTVFDESSEASNSQSELFQALVDGQNMPFISHSGEGNMQNYLAMNLPFEPASKLREHLEETQGLRLKNRGEAHITVVTPVEFDQTLKNFVSITEINQIAKNLKIQQAHVKALCMGTFKLPAAEELSQVFFVVVQSSDLLAIRAAVQELFEQRGGTPGAFKASDLEAHVTLGFTKRDLHKSDGANKTQSSCLAE